MAQLTVEGKHDHLGLSLGEAPQRSEQLIALALGERLIVWSGGVAIGP